MNTAVRSSPVTTLVKGRRFGVCEECSTRPETRRLDPLPPGASAPARCRLCGCLLGGNHTTGIAAQPRQFTQVDRALIRKMASILPAAQLLDLLNDRLVADLGPDSPRYTTAMLADELRQLPAPEPTASASDWGSMRKILATARREGVLAVITDQMVENFSVVFSLSPARSLRLRDLIQSAQSTDQGGR